MIPTLSTYLFQLVVGILVVFYHNTIKLKQLPMFRLMLFFLLWIAVVPLIVDDKWLTSFKYSFYFFTIFIGVSQLNTKNVKQYINFNIRLLQAMGLSILIFSLILIISEPIPVFRGIRTSIMHSSANEDALILAVSFPFIFLLKSNKIKWISIVYYFYFLILYNSTRSAILMSSMALIMMLYPKFKKMKVLYAILIFSFLIGSSGIYLEYILNDSFFSKGISAIENYGEGNFTGRVAGIWLPIVEQTLKESPIFGFGAKDYLEKMYGVTYCNAGARMVYSARSPHNFFIMFLFSWGAVGLIAISIIYFYYMCLSYKLFLCCNNTLSAALFSSWVSFTGMNFIANSFSYRGWTILTLLILLTYFMTVYNSMQNQSNMHLKT